MTSQNLLRIDFGDVESLDLAERCEWCANYLGEVGTADGMHIDCSEMKVHTLKKECKYFKSVVPLGDDAL